MTVIRQIPYFRRIKENKPTVIAESGLDEVTNKRNELTYKFFRNNDLILEFQWNYECYCDISDNWEKPAFGDSKITNRQYYQTLINITKVEYSDQQREAIKTITIHEIAVINYIKNLDAQYENMKALNDEIISKENSLLKTFKK